MIYYLWVFVLSGISIVSLVAFLISITKDIGLMKKLKKSKSALILNFSLLLISLSSISMVVYLFLMLKEQIDILS